MVREVTGVRVEHKSPYAKVKPKVPTDANQEVDLKPPEGNNEAKDCEVKECTSEMSQVENSNENNQDVLAVKSTNFDGENPEIRTARNEDQKENSPDKSSSDKAVVGNVKMKDSPQSPSVVTVDKQVYESPIAIETPVSSTPCHSKSSDSAMKSQPRTPIVAKKNSTDDDNWSMASSGATARTTRSRLTAGVTPSFASDERLEKRKEYYTKLEEKRKALEAERQEYEARTREEEEAVIKQLRKTMSYKANAVPNFYYEKPAPKKELKKLPTTRAVSPKLGTGRRKSCSDVVSNSHEAKVRARVSSRLSLGSHKEKERSNSANTSRKKDEVVGGNNASTTPKKKDQLTGASSTSKPRVRSMPVKKSTTPKITEQANADITVES